MTIRGGIKVFMSILGVCLMLALWHSQAALEAHGGWYLIAMLMALSGALPKEVALGSGLCFVILMGNALFRPDTMLFGLSWPHALFCAGLAVGTYFLGQESEVRVLRCSSCFWHGPSTEARFGRCPHCGQSQLKDEKRTVLIHA